MKKVHFHKFNTCTDYKTVWEFQENKLLETIDYGSYTKNETVGHLIFCEHNHVFTLGKNGNQSNLLVDNLKLNAAGAEFFKIDRGGDITYHGPGQLVGYPIFNLNLFKIGIKQYVYNIEQAVINLLSDLGIESERLDGATGVWLNSNKKGFQKKICAIGVKVSKGTTMHGFALNVNTDLNYFSYINPCGFTDKSVTSIENELKTKQNFDIISNRLLEHFKNIFEIETNEKL